MISSWRCGESEVNRSQSHPVNFQVHLLYEVRNWQWDVAVLRRSCYSSAQLEGAAQRVVCMHPHGRCGPQIPLRSRDTFTFYLMVNGQPHVKHHTGLYSTLNVQSAKE